MIVGVVVDHASGVLPEAGDLVALAQQRSREAAAIRNTPR
jgi:hypothetical protein